MGAKRRAAAGTYDEARLAGLYRHAAAKKGETVRRLQEAIDRLKGKGDGPLTVEAIERESGLRYTSIKRNEEALALWRQYSAYHQARRKGPKPRDPLLSMSRADLIAAVRRAREKQGALEEALHVANGKQDDLGRWYRNLLRDQMRTERRVAELEAEQARYQAHLAYLRSSLQEQEHRQS